GAAVGSIQAEDHPPGGGLAGPVGPDEPGDLPGGHGERHPVERQRRPEPLAQLADLDAHVHDRNARQRAAQRRHSAEPSSPSLARGTPTRRQALTMIGMASRTGERADAGRWAAAWRQLVAAPQATAAATLLGLAAVTEAGAPAAGAGAPP